MEAFLFLLVIGWLFVAALFKRRYQRWRGGPELTSESDAQQSHLRAFRNRARDIEEELTRD